MFLLGLIVGILISAVAMKFLMPKLMFLEKESPYNFERTVEEIEKRAKDMGWGVPIIHDLGNNIKEKAGVEVGPVKVVELCKPEYASKVLGSDSSKVISSFMPCAIGVYEKKDGRTFVSKRNIKLFSLIFGGELGQVFKKVAEEEDKITDFLK